MQLTTLKTDTNTVQSVSTKQFKSIQVHIRFIGPLTKETVTKRSLMLALMRAKSKAYPSRKALAKAAEMLYDTHFTAQALKLGTKHIIQFTLAFVHPRFIEDQSYLNEVLTFLKTLIHEPFFDEKTLSEEKRFLSDYFDAEYSNKSRYAYKRYNEHLYEGHPFNIHALGDVHSIDTVTLSDVEASYQAMLNEDSVVISITGDHEDVISLKQLNERLALKGKPLPKNFLFKHTFNEQPLIKETMDVSQERLLIAFNTDTYFGDDAYFTALVFNSLFGEHSDSLLFQTVRERHSLAYYVHASYSPFSGIITVMSGMDAANINKAKTMIDDVLDQIKNGDFDDERFEIAKTAIKLNVKQSYDNPSSLSLKGLRHALFNTPFHEDYILSSIEAIKKDNVMTFAKKIKKILTYQLGRDEDANN